MLDFGWGRVMEEMEGRKLTSCLKEDAGISHPTAIKLMRGEGNEKTAIKAFTNTLQNNRISLIKAGLSEQEANAVVSNGPPMTSVFQAVMYRFWQHTYAPKTYAFAEELDNAALALHWLGLKDGSEAIYDCPPERVGLTGDYHRNHGDCGSRQPLIRNMVLSFFSMWDIEFHHRFFAKYSPAPIFTLVSPALNELYSAEKGREPFRFPVKRLTDLLGCISERVKYGSWPSSPPTVTTMARMSNEEERTLVTWRAGLKKFRTKDFLRFWDALVGEPGTVYSAPLPLYVAAMYFQTLLCSAGGRRGEEKSIDTIDSEYRYWWEKHRTSPLFAEAKTGSQAMPDCLTKI